MRRKVSRWLNLLIGGIIGAVLGRTVFEVWKYLHYPELYVVQSIPWYTNILFCWIEAVALVVIVAVVKMFLRKK